MYKQKFTNEFNKCLKRDSKRGLNIDLLEAVIDKLTVGKILEPKYRDHALTGNYSGYRECHIKPDWLLIYYIEGDEIVFVKTGSHSDLFG